MTLKVEEFVTVLMTVYSRRLGYRNTNNSTMIKEPLCSDYSFSLVVPFRWNSREGECGSDGEKCELS